MEEEREGGVEGRGELRGRGRGRGRGSGGGGGVEGEKRRRGRGGGKVERKGEGKERMGGGRRRYHTPIPPTGVPLQPTLQQPKQTVVGKLDKRQVPAKHFELLDAKNPLLQGQHCTCPCMY